MNTPDMNIRIQVRHDAASEGIKKYLTQEFQRLQEKFENVMTSAEFVVDHEGPTGHVKKIECIIDVPNETLTVNEASDEIHKSIDAAFHVLDRLLQKHKQTHARPGAKIRHDVERQGLPEIMEPAADGEADVEADVEAAP